MYLPEINWLLAVLSIACVVGFRSTAAIGHAFGVAVVAVMVITTSLTALVMLMVWRTNPWLVALFCAGLTFAEGIYLTSVLYKVRPGMVRQTCLLTGRRSTTQVCRQLLQPLLQLLSALWQRCMQLLRPALQS